MASRRPTYSTVSEMSAIAKTSSTGSDCKGIAKSACDRVAKCATMDINNLSTVSYKKVVRQKHLAGSHGVLNHKVRHHIQQPKLVPDNYLNINKFELPLFRRLYLRKAEATSVVPQSISTSPVYTSWLILTVRSCTLLYFFSHSLSTLNTRSRLMVGSSASPKCLSTRFFRASIPLRSSFESWPWTSFLNTERECDERWAMDCALAPGCVSRVSVDSMNS